MVKRAVKANLIGAVVQTVRVQVPTMKANIKIFVNVSSRSTFFQSMIKFDKMIYLIKNDKFNDIINHNFFFT